MADIAGPRVISAVFTQHVKPANFHGYTPLKRNILVEFYTDSVPGSQKKANGGSIQLRRLNRQNARRCRVQRETTLVDIFANNFGPTYILLYPRMRFVDEHVVCEIMEQSTLLCKQADETKALSKNNLQPASQSTSFGDWKYSMVLR